MKTLIKNWYRFLSPRFQTLHLEYKVDMKPRYGQGLPPHEQLYSIIHANRKVYEENLALVLNHKENLWKIKSKANGSDELTWLNGFFPGLDIAVLYMMVNKYKPDIYFEIGSGNSTKVARKAISENKLGTKIVSLDPFPRAQIDKLSDEIIRSPLENYGAIKSIADRLKSGDILFIDNSHRVLPNSDATVVFLELLPVLKPGVIVHIHDIYLPYDYPPFMCDRFYSEQYVLAAMVLANPIRYKTIMPNYFISEDKGLSEMINPLWNSEHSREAERHGGSYWLEIN